MKSKALSGVAIAALAFAGCATEVGPDSAPTAGDRAGNVQATCAGRIRRITDAEYVASVRSALQISLADGEIITSGGTEPFTEAVAVEYQTAAQTVSRQAAAPVAMSSLLGTDSARPATDAQIAAFIHTNVSALWQRSVTPGEAAILQSIYRGSSTLGDDGPSRAFDLVLQAVLQSPSFLFRADCN